MTEFCNMSDLIDSRDIIERIDALEIEIEEIEETYTENDDCIELKEEFETLQDIIDNIYGARLGVTLIHEDYFETYAKSYAADLGLINDDTAWPATCIDWDQATNELKADFYEIDYDGQSFYHR